MPANDSQYSMNLTAIILTYNEARHLARCIDSLAGVADRIVVADCFSTDDTLAIAAAKGARVIQRAWVNYATQFNWAVTQLEPGTEWVLRIDADEVLTPALAAEIRARLKGLGTEIDGVYCGRRMTFQGRLIRWGGVFPVQAAVQRLMADNAAGRRDGAYTPLALPCIEMWRRRFVDAGP